MLVPTPKCTLSSAGSDRQMKSFFSGLDSQYTTTTGNETSAIRSHRLAATCSLTVRSPIKVVFVSTTTSICKGLTLLSCGRVIVAGDERTRSYIAGVSFSLRQTTKSITPAVLFPTVIQRAVDRAVRTAARPFIAHTLV